jgi:hypothetical protein
VRTKLYDYDGKVKIWKSHGVTGWHIVSTGLWFPSWREAMDHVINNGGPGWRYDECQMWMNVNDNCH